VTVGSAPVVFFLRHTRYFSDGNIVTVSVVLDADLAVVLIDDVIVSNDVCSRVAALCLRRAHDVDASLSKFACIKEILFICLRQPRVDVMIAIF
jgi:hypothetical protein